MLHQLLLFCNKIASRICGSRRFSSKTHPSILSLRDITSIQGIAVSCDTLTFILPTVFIKASGMLTWSTLRIRGTGEKGREIQGCGRHMMKEDKLAGLLRDVAAGCNLRKVEEQRRGRMGLKVTCPERAR